MIYKLFQILSKSGVWPNWKHPYNHDYGENTLKSQKQHHVNRYWCRILQHRPSCQCNSKEPNFTLARLATTMFSAVLNMILIGVSCLDGIDFLVYSDVRLSPHKEIDTLSRTCVCLPTFRFTLHRSHLSCWILTNNHKTSNIETTKIKPKFLLGYMCQNRSHMQAIHGNEWWRLSDTFDRIPSFTFHHNRCIP